MDQVLDSTHTLDAPRLLPHPVDVVLALHDAAQEHDALLGVHADLALRDVGTAEQLALDLLRERDVVERLLGPPARVDGPSRGPDRVRLGAPGADERAALATAQSRQRTVAGHVATAATGPGVEEVFEQSPKGQTARSDGDRHRPRRTTIDAPAAALKCLTRASARVGGALAPSADEHGVPPLPCRTLPLRGEASRCSVRHLVREPEARKQLGTE